MKNHISMFWSIGFAGNLLVSAPPQEPMFRAEVDMVHLVTTVVDRRGNYVSDLTVEDFELFEDGRRQTITYFGEAARQDELPLSLVLLIDASDSVRRSLSFIQQTAGDFLDDILRLGDVETAVVQFSTNIKLLDPFSSKRKRVVTAIRSAWPGGGTRLFDALWLSAGQLLWERTGRRVLVVFSDGEDLHSGMSKEEALRKLQTTKVSLFAVGFVDPDFPGDFEILQELCEATGGFLIRSEDQPGRLKAALEQIRLEISHQYVLGYVSNNPREDGVFRKITLRVQRRGFSINHRSGYYID